ncbi:MAG TPA: hypothetical protein VE993_13695 [Stellaceae bacterium]|nr:hypothetical protein [Stellaceae bacterium]
MLRCARNDSHSIGSDQQDLVLLTYCAELATIVLYLAILQGASPLICQFF